MSFLLHRSGSVGAWGATPRPTRLVNIGCSRACNINYVPFPPLVGIGHQTTSVKPAGSAGPGNVRA